MQAATHGNPYACACACVTLQSLATFPDKISDSNLKAVNALKGVGKGTMERVRDMDQRPCSFEKRRG